MRDDVKLVNLHDHIERFKIPAPEASEIWPKEMKIFDSVEEAAQFIIEQDNANHRQR
jgi:hypothetical protein